MKNTIALMLLSVLRFHIRYFPIRFGKRWLYRAVVEPYLSWRPYGTVARMRAGPRVEIQLPDQIQDRIYFFGTWEPEISDYIASTLAPGDCFVDVGANIGYFSLLAASIVGNSGAVHSIEASPSIFAVLSRNVMRSGYTNITLHNKAASDAPRRLPIFLGPAENRGATTTVSSVAVRKGQHLEAEVQADTLVAIVGEAELLAARLVKIDIEGAEYSLVSSIAHLLPRFSPATEWLIEVSPEAISEQGKSADTLLAMFRAAGYDLLRIRNDYSDDSYLSAKAPRYLEILSSAPKVTVDILARRPK
ncbi:MAG: FkbM family methyltransferase [Betaproteobacteria bacterium]